MTLGEAILNALFYIFALVAIGGAVAVAASQNIVRSAFALLAVLFSAAALYALASVDFIVVIQILIYVGGILVLIIFAVMLTHRITDVNISNESAPSSTAFFAAALVLFSIILILVLRPWAKMDPLTQGKLDMLVAQLKDAKPVVAGAAEEELKKIPVHEGIVRYFREKVAELQSRAPDADFEQRSRHVLEAWNQKFAGLTKRIGTALMGDFLLPFEAISVLLLAALIGAAFLARKEVVKE